MAEAQFIIKRQGQVNSQTYDWPVPLKPFPKKTKQIIKNRASDYAHAC